MKWQMRSPNVTRLAHVVALGSALMWSSSVRAMDLDTGSADLKVRWDNTAKYTLGVRTQGRSAALTDPSLQASTVNQDDGDRNFDKGLSMNRFDLLSEFDASYSNFGARASGSAWFDGVYNRSTANGSPFTSNSSSVSNTRFTEATSTVQGKKVELLDAFVYAKQQLGDMSATVRVGRYALQWGESLFFGANGIAGAQAPVDLIKLLSVPNAQFKEIIRPTWQLSGQLQVTPSIAVGAYYGLEFERSRLPAAGSYFSSVDFLDAGGERLIVGAPGGPFTAPPAFFRSGDLDARNSGQFGVQVKLRPEGIETDLGLYAIQYHAKDPQIYLRPALVPDFATGQVGTYQLVFPEDVRAVGASISKSVGIVNLAAEVSFRFNTPLVSDAQVVTPGTQADNSDHPLYAVGRSAHANLSWLASFGPSFIAREASLLGEVAWNRRLSVTKNRAALDPNTTVDAVGLRLIYEPAYRQVLPGLDITVPVGLGFNPAGKSSVVSGFNGGVDKGGDFNVGIGGAYLDRWRFKATYSVFLGPEGTFLDADNHLSFKQPLKDRNFFSLSVWTTI